MDTRNFFSGFANLWIVNLVARMFYLVLLIGSRLTMYSTIQYIFLSHNFNNYTTSITSASNWCSTCVSRGASFEAPKRTCETSKLLGLDSVQMPLPLCPRKTPRVHKGRKGLCREYTFMIHDGSYLRIPPLIPIFCGAPNTVSLLTYVGDQTC